MIIRSWTTTTTTIYHYEKCKTMTWHFLGYIRSQCDSTVKVNQSIKPLSKLISTHKQHNNAVKLEKIKICCFVLQLSSMINNNANRRTTSYILFFVLYMLLEMMVKMLCFSFVLHMFLTMVLLHLSLQLVTLSANHNDTCLWWTIIIYYLDGNNQ